MEEKKDILFSLVDIDTLDMNKDKSYLYDYLRICESEYDTELSKAEKLKNYKRLIERQEQYVAPYMEKQSTSKKNNYKIGTTKEMNDIKSYYKDIMEAENEEDFKIILPSRNDIHFLKIVNSIILAMNRDIEDLNEIRICTFDERELEEIDLEIKELTEKLEKLISYRDGIEIVEEDLTIQNKSIHLIFVPNESGKPLFLQDIKGKDKSDVISVLNYLNSGKIKIHRKLFGDLGGMKEIRYRDSYRIFIDKTENETDCFIFIIGLIVKKTLWNSFFSNFIYVRGNNYQEYKRKIEPIIASRNTEELIRKNDIIAHQIINKLEGEIKHAKVKK